MIRDYSNFDAHLNSLSEDVYEQPEDEGHLQLAYDMIYWMQAPSCHSVLDAGSGDGFCQPMFENKGMAYVGICLGSDGDIGRTMGHTLINMDYTFTNFPENTFDLVFARHSLEHSPFPLLTLMEWHRISNKYLGLVMPNPSHYTFTGRNHYSVAWPTQIAWWLRRAGWRIIQAKLFNTEFWFVCEKRPVVSYEGWAKVPLAHKIYEFERDKLKIDGIDIKTDEYEEPEG